VSEALLAIFTAEQGLDKLLDKCRNGDANAWSVLVDRFSALVYSVARKHGLSDDDAADVFQTTFQALHGSIDRIQAGASLPKWLSVTAARESLKIIRFRNRTVATDTATLDDVIADEERSAEISATESVSADMLRKAVKDLPGRCSDLLQMLYFEESSYEEIVRRTGTPIGAIGPTRARCLEKLRKILESEGFFE
jgi:RNA polymerase sigma factor (sigma-70 family)